MPGHRVFSSFGPAIRREPTSVRGEHGTDLLCSGGRGAATSPAAAGLLRRRARLSGRDRRDLRHLLRRDHGAGAPTAVDRPVQTAAHARSAVASAPRPWGNCRAAPRSRRCPTRPPRAARVSRGERPGAPASSSPRAAQALFVPRRSGRSRRGGEPSLPRFGESVGRLDRQRKLVAAEQEAMKVSIHSQPQPARAESERLCPKCGQPIAPGTGASTAAGPEHGTDRSCIEALGRAVRDLQDRLGRVEQPPSARS